MLLIFQQSELLELVNSLRIVELHARRLQNQERITNGVADDIEEHLNPLGSAVIIEASMDACSVEVFQNRMQL